MGILVSKETKIENARKFLTEHNKVSVSDLETLEQTKYYNAIDTLGKYNIAYSHLVPELSKDKVQKRKTTRGKLKDSYRDSYEM